MNPVREGNETADGVRLLSHRPSVLYKLEHLATEPVEGDIAIEGLQLAGPGWEERLKELLGSISHSERACLFAVRLDDEQGLPIPADTLLDRARTDWFPEFLSHGEMTPHFQPIIDLASGKPYGREALMRGKMGVVELRGAELIAAAEALFVNIDPRAVLDVESSMRTTWPIVIRLGGEPSRICLELIRPERSPDRDVLKALVDAHRERGALVALDDLSGGAESLACLEELKPDIGKIDRAMTAGIQHSPARRRLVAALVEVAHEQNCRVVAEGIERVDEFEAMRELGVDLGQGFYFGQPTATPMAVDPRLVRRRAELA